MYVVSNCLSLHLVPYDGTPREEIETISLPLTITVSVLNILSIIYARLCLLFNIVIRNNRLYYSLYYNNYCTSLLNFYRIVHLDGTRFIFSGDVGVFITSLVVEGSTVHMEQILVMLLDHHKHFLFLEIPPQAVGLQLLLEGEMQTRQEQGHM